MINIKREPNNTLLVLMLFVIFSAFIIAGGFWWFGNQKKLARKTWEETLDSIAELKKNNISEWRQERLNDALIISQWGIISAYFRDKEIHQEKKKALISRIEPVLTRYGFDNFFLLNKSGEVVFTANEKYLGALNESTLKLFHEALTEKRIIFSSFYQCHLHKTVHLDLIAPVVIRRDHNDEVVGGLIFTIDPDKFLYPLIQSWPTPSPTAETLLVQKEGEAVLFLNELRHSKAAPLTIKFPLTEKRLTAVRAVEGWQGTLEGDDYRGVPVLAVTKAIPDTLWHMVAKIDLEEIYRPLYREARLIVIGVIALILLVGAVLGWILSTQRKRHFEVLYRLEQERQTLLSHFEFLVKYANDIILLMDQEGNLKEVNDRAVAAYGYDREELLQLNIRDLVPENETPALSQWSREELAGPGRIYEGLHRRRGGGVFPVEVSVNLIQVEGKQYFQEIIRDISERKEAESELQKLASVVKYSQELVCLATLDGQGIFINEAGSRILGISPEEVHQHHIPEVIPQEFLPLLQDEILPALLGGETWQGDLQFLNLKTGARTEVHAMAFSIPDFETGRPRFLANVSLDITERKRAEEEVSRSRREWEEIFQAIGHPTMILDANHTVLAANRATAKITGKSATDMVGRKCFEIFHPDISQPPAGCPLEKLLASGRLETMEMEMAVLGGTFLVSCTPMFSEDGQLKKVFHIATDITERKRAEEAFQVLVNQAPMGIFIVQDGKFKIVNPGFVKICGYSEEELIGRYTLDLVAPDYRAEVRQNALRMLKGESQTPYELPIVTKDGETRWVVEKVAPTIYQGQQAALGYFWDISEHKSLESQFIQAQKMEAVGRLAGGVAHDFNNMLNVIMGYCEIMELDLNQKDPLVHHLLGIKKAADRAAALTRQLLAFSRKELLQPQVLNLNDQVAGIEKMLRRLIGEDIEMTVVLEPSLGAVKADPSHIEQIVLNLAVNARDAMPQGGKLTLETANVYLDQDYVRTHLNVAPGPYVMLAVTDNGQGMDAATQARIFEPFFTTKEIGKGTGLGLCTVYGIAKQNGGQIQVYSEIGRGTTFKVYLPQVLEAVSEVPAAKSAAQELYGSETILVVEDEDMVRELICHTLDIYGYEVLEARNGGEALLLCERHPGPIHLLLTDVVMPQMSGRDLIDRLKPLRPDMKVLYMSGYTENAVVRHGLMDSTVSYIQKPFSPKTLVEKIRKVLDEAVR